MTTESMNIHRALAELKTLEARIGKEIPNTNFCAVKKHGSNMVNGMSVDEFKTRASAAYDKINDLIARYNAIKFAVANSNAITKVTIAGVEYTVAVAIAMKQHGLDNMKKLLRVMEDQYSGAVRTMEYENQKVDANADEFINNNYGKKDNGKSGGVDAKEIIEARAAYIAPQERELVDAIGIKKEIDRLKDFIDTFNSEVDAVLSTSNANVEVTINY